MLMDVAVTNAKLGTGISPTAWDVSVMDTLKSVILTQEFVLDAGTIQEAHIVSGKSEYCKTT